MLKAYHLSTVRNEWANWNGDHHKVRRGNPKVFFKLNEAEKRAEHLRTPGSYFLIREQPIMEIYIGNQAYGLTEVFSDAPFKAIARKLEAINSPNDLLVAVDALQWGVVISIDDHMISMADDCQFFERTSSPGKGKNSLGWSLKPIKYDLTHMCTILNHLGAS